MAAAKTDVKIKTTQQSRMNFRLAPEIKERVARAAALTGRDMTEFAVSALNEKADEVIEKHDHLLLDSDDYKFFLRALDDTDTQPPSARAAAAADKYRRGKRKGVRHHLAD